MSQVLSENEVNALLLGIEESDIEESDHVYDKLTGLISRGTFERAFQSQLEKADRGDQILSLAFLDIDFFTRINADFGHEAGDEVLKVVSKKLMEIGGKEGIVARYGGEEFALLFPSKEREQVFLLVEQIRSALDTEHEIKLKKKKVKIGIQLSGGVAAFPTDGQNESEIIRKADQALYRAKKTGRNKICIAQEEKMATKTTHYTLTQLERLASLSKESNIGEAALLREALDDLLFKHKVSKIESNLRVVKEKK